MSTWKDLAKEYNKDENDNSKFETNVTSHGDSDKTQALNYYEIGDIFSTLSSFVGEILLPHPLISIKRQCQLSTDPYRLHWTPFTVILIPFRLVNSQGFSCLWKGIGSTISLYISRSAVENILHEVLRIPKRFHKYSSIKMIGYNLLLKAISAAILTPFYASVLVETVKSDCAGGQVAPWNFILEGLNRCTFIYPDTINRLLPMWRIVPVYVSYCVLHYLLQRAATFLAQSYMEVDQYDPSSKSNRGNDMAHFEAVFMKYYGLAWSTVVGTFAADLMLYPVEMILNRLCVQGTRILIDNVNYSDGMKGIGEMCTVISCYSGFTDALQKILEGTVPQHHVHGVMGMGGMGIGCLYRGFGAVILKTSIQISLIMLIKWAVTNFIMHNKNNSWRYRGSSNYESASHAAMTDDGSPLRRKR